MEGQSVAQRVRMLRHALKMTQTQFGKLAGGVTKGAVSQWEGGTTAPERDVLEALKAHKINPRWVMYGEGEPMLPAGPPDQPDWLGADEQHILDLWRSLTESQRSVFAIDMERTTAMNERLYEELSARLRHDQRPPALSQEPCHKHK